MPIGNLPDINTPAKTLQDVRNEELNFIVDDIRASNYDKALSVVAPMSEITGNLQNVGGLPKQETIASLSMKDANKLKLVDYSNVKASDVYESYSDGSRIARYDDYSTVNLDQEDVHAKEQSTAQKWTNGLTAMIPNTLTNIGGQLIGTVYGAIAAASTGTMEAMYDNKVFDAIDDINTYTRNKLPIYKSKEDREATGFNYLTKASTWADDMLNGASFMVGAIASELIIEAATEGMASSTAVARWAPRVGKYFGESAAAIEKMNEARKLSNIGERVYGATELAEQALAKDAVIKAGKAAQFGKQVRFALTSAPYESAFEAHTFKKEAEKNFYDNFQALNGRMPTTEEEANFRRNINSAADGVFGFNMAILIPSNFAMMGHWFDIKSPLEAPGKWLDSKLFGIGYKQVGEEFVETSANKLQKVIGKSYSFAKPMISEGLWEEGMQSVAQNTGKNWVEARYDPKYTKNTLGLVDSFTKALGDTYGTAEGWKEIEAGMVIGLLGGTIGNKIATGKWNPDYANATAKNKLIVDTRNTYSAQRTAEAIAMSNRMQQTNENLQQAQASGDMLGQERARKEAALTQLNFAHNLGYMDDAVNSTVASINNIEDSKIMKEYGVDEQGAKDLKKKMADEYKETAKNYKKNSDFAHYYIAETLTKGEKGLLGTFGAEHLREAIAYELTMGSETDKFSSNVLEAIKQKVGSTFASQDLMDALTIDDVLIKAGKETKKAAEKKVSELTKLKGELNSLDEEYKKVETTFYNSTSEEGKKTLLARMDKITARKQEVEKERENLAKEYEILFNAAKMKNPFNKDSSAIAITANRLDILKDQANKIREIVSSYKEVNPQDALHLEKLVQEYTNSLAAYKRHADVARMLTSKDLGLTGKKAFLRSFGKEVSPSQATIDLIEALKPRMAENVNQVVQATAEGNVKVKEAVEKGKAAPEGEEVETPRETEKKGATIAPPTAEEKQTTKDAEKQKVIDEYDARIADLGVPKLEVGKEYTFNGKKVKITAINENIGRSIYSVEVEDENGNERTITKFIDSEEGFKALFKEVSEEEATGVTTFDLNQVKKPSGSIGNQGATFEGAKGIMEFLGINIDYKNDSFSEIIEHLKNSPEDLKKLKDFVEKEPIIFRELPDGTYQLEDGHHRATLLYYSGVESVPAKIVNAGEYIPGNAPTSTSKSNSKAVDKLQKEKQAKLDTIDKKYQDKVEEPVVEKKTLVQSIIDMVKNSPYLLEHFGENVLDAVPTTEEIEEFYELAARAIDDPRIDTDLIAYKNPYNSTRFTPTTRPSLTKAEVLRLQELNQKMADWQLLEGHKNTDGISLQEMIMQAVATNQVVEPIVREKLTDSDLINLSDNEPSELDNNSGIRNEQYVQVYENVFVKKKGNSVVISHLTLPGLLQRMGITGEIGYVQTKWQKGKKVEVKGTAKTISLEEIEENSLPGSDFIVTLKDGTKVRLSMERSGGISMNSTEDFKKVMDEANMKHVEGTLNKNGGYSPVYDLESGEKLKTDYKNASDYSPREIYNMKPGESAEVSFSIDMQDEYNLKLIQNYEKGLEQKRSVEELDKELFENIKIHVVDDKGRKLGDLKAAYDIAGVPGYLDLRREALEQFKARMESGVMGKVELSKTSFIKHIFLGSPNFTFENSAIKMFNILPKQVIDYGYIENGKVVLKNSTKGVREDFVKGLLGREGQPVVVVKQGQYLVAFPIALKEESANLADQAVDIFKNSKNKAEAALKLNQLLADNGFSPATYNLFYIDENNQNIVNEEGYPTDSLLKAFDDLTGVKKVGSVKDWMLPEHTAENLAEEASIGVDMTDSMFSSPKPIIELDNLKENIKDWFTEAQKNGDVTDEKAVEIATKIFNRKKISLQEAQFVQSDKVTEALNRMYDLNDDAQEDSDEQKNKPCKK